MTDIGALVGSYTQQDSEGVIDFLRKIGIPEDKLTQHAGAKLSIKVSQDAASGEVTVVRKISEIERTYKFKLGEKYTQTNLLGESVEATATLEDGKLVDVAHTGKLAGRKLTLEKDGANLKMTVSLGEANISITLVNEA